MPVTALPAIGAITGGIGSIGAGAGGKKAQKKASGLAQQQLGLEQGMLNRATPLLQGAGNYWSSLLKGGNAAQQAVGPYASLIGQAGQGARNSILATTPRGGEQNLAVANTFNDTSNNIARLYAGMQPIAAEGLSNVGNAFLGAGTSLSGPATGAGTYAAGLGAQGAQNAGAGFGSMLYNALNKVQKQGKWF